MLTNLHKSSQQNTALYETCTKLYNTLQNSQTVCNTSLQNFTTHFQQKNKITPQYTTLFKILQHSTHVYNTKTTTLYNILHNLANKKTQQTLQHSTPVNTTRHFLTNVYKTLQTFTKLHETFTKQI